MHDTHRGFFCLQVNTGKIFPTNSVKCASSILFHPLPACYSYTITFLLASWPSEYTGSFEGDQSAVGVEMRERL